MYHRHSHIKKKHDRHLHLAIERSAKKDGGEKKQTTKREGQGMRAEHTVADRPTDGQTTAPAIG